MNLRAIHQPGNSALLEVPLTIVRSRLATFAHWVYHVRGLRRFALRFGGSPLNWLYPDGANGAQMLGALRQAVSKRRAHVEFLIHSSELMPGGRKTFADEASIDRLYSDLRKLFDEAGRTCRGMTLKEFREAWVAREAVTGNRHPS